MFGRAQLTKGASMGLAELFVPLGGMIMIVMIAGLITRLIATAMLHRTIREAMRADAGSVPALTERLDRHPPWGDALLGWLFLALAVGIALLGLTEEDPQERQQMLRATIVPVVIGVTALIYARFAARGHRGDARSD